MRRASTPVSVHLSESLQPILPKVLACGTHFGRTDPVVPRGESGSRNGKRGNDAALTGWHGNPVQKSDSLHSLGGLREVPKQPLPNVFRYPEHRLDLCSRGD